MRRVALSFGLCLAAAAAAATPWPEPTYNPDPAPGDLTLPMPCGGSMVFRPVAVPDAGSPIDDTAVLLGNPASSANDYNDGAHGAFLAAPFPTASGPPVYWIGKYDVTVGQMQALSGTCPASTVSTLPQTDVSWYDATAFGAAYSSWMLTNNPSLLPARGKSIGFFRLPSEVEWEYAARGGAAVPPAIYTAPSWAPTAKMAAYAVAGDGATLSPVGSRQPNPLGLYDMLGDAAQWVQDPYQFTRLGRLSGLTGGLVIRGASYDTPLANLSSATRLEVPPFDPATGKATKLNDVGFRLVIGVAIGDNPARAAAMHQALTAAANARIAPSSQPVLALPGLIADTADPDMQAGLQAIGAALQTAGTDTVHQEIDSAISLTYGIYRIQKDDALLKTMYESPVFDDLRQNQVYMMDVKNLAVGQDNLRRIMGAYALSLQSIIASAPQPIIDKTLQDERIAMKNDADPRLAFVGPTKAFLDEMANGSFLNSDQLLGVIGQVKASTSPQ
jgi:hypothetical protein